MKDTDGTERRERGTKSQRGGEGRREWNGRGSCAREAGIFVCGHPEFIVTPLLIGPICLLSQGLFEEPVRPWLPPHQASQQQ